MIGPMYEDPHFTFRFADDRIIPRFHLEGVETGRRVSVFKIDPRTKLKALTDRLGKNNATGLVNLDSHGIYRVARASRKTHRLSTK